MAFEYKQAFDLITEKVEEELKKTGFTKEKVASDNDNELVSLFTSENVAYSVHYTVDKQLMELRTCGMTADEGPDNDWKTLATWLYDDSTNDQKDAMSIANDFVEGVSGTVAIKRAKQSKTKKKKEDGNADPKFLAKRFITVFPELREEIQMEEDCYYPFRGATFAKEHIAPKLPDYIHRANKRELEKFAGIFNTQYGNGDADTRAVITTVIINSLDDEDYNTLSEYFDDDLGRAAKFARKYKNKTVKPEVVKVKKPSRFSTLNDQQR